MLENCWSNSSFVCVGLDFDIWKAPTKQIKGSKYMAPAQVAVAFNRMIVDATKDLVCAYKPNVAFYEAFGAQGIAALRRTIIDIKSIAPDIPVILDAKRADIGNTNIGYADFAFDYLCADAITVHPYLGGDALSPFLERSDKGVIVLCRTSNPGAGEFQDGLLCGDTIPGGHMPVYKYVAHRVVNTWNMQSNCAVVVGATYPDELREVREIVGDMPILIPGIGAQGGDVEKTVSAGKDSRGKGMIINSSRGIIFASQGSDFLEAARFETEKLRDNINNALRA
jgi:orotidine-5'-phosphate decarboxylase